MIKIINVNKDYKISNGKISALENINITFPNTGFYSIIGRSGAGKTTLLNCIAGIDKVTSGQILYNDIDICKIKGIDLDNYRESVAFIFQDYNLLREYTVEENIALSIQIQGVSKEATKEIVRDVLIKVGLPNYEKRKIVELSGGEQQRVVIARALAKKSKVIFCDESTGNLDEITARELFDLLKELSKELLIINVTHNNALANDYSDGIIEIEKGKVIKNTIIINDNNIIESNYVKDKNKDKFSFSLISKLCFEHFRYMKVLTILMLLIFLCSFTIFTVFKSVSNFNTSQAMVSTLKNNNQTILQVVNYKDYVEKSEDEYGTIYNYGVRVSYRDNVQEDFEKIKEDLNGKAEVYKSYYFIKTFEALFDIDYPFELEDNGDDFIFHYHTFNFEEIIAVNDFSNFSMPMLYGKLPEKENEILIYDYMADCLLYHKAYDCELKDMIGKKIIDKGQNLELEIAGIIKSNYQNFEYTDGVSKSSNLIGQSYLTSLKCIFANESLVKKINKNVRTVNEIKKYIVENEEIFYTENKKINKIVYLDNVDFDFVYKNEEHDFGYILTLSQVSELLGIDREPTEEEIEYIIKAFNDDGGDIIGIAYQKYYHSTVTSPGFYSYNSTILYGIVDDETFSDSNALYLLDYPSDADGIEVNKFYIALNKDYSDAKEVIDYFAYPSHDDEYYEECIKNNNFYTKEGFCIYDNNDMIITNASDYLSSINKTSKSAVILSFVLIIVGITGLCLLSIRKQVYKIGILKSLGAKNYQLELSYVFYVFLLAMIGCALSIPASYYVMSVINTSFINKLQGIDLIMFTISPKGILFTLLSTIISSLFSSIVTYIIFTINPPVMLIRHNKDR